MVGPISALFLSVLLWGLVGLYGFSNVWWAIEVAVLSRGWRSSEPDRYGLDDIQIRILTIDAERVVQKTVDEIPDAIPPTERYVIAEDEISVAGAQVAVVPDSFDSKADAKGRAHQWALENIDCDREYVVYLDEDTRVQNLSGVPGADFVQFTEQPELIVDRSSSQTLLQRIRAELEGRIVYLCEIFRVGYQLEQFGFHRLAYPLYAWGGGFAIRYDLEREVTWRDSTLTEDTNLIWRAGKLASSSGRIGDLDYQLLDNGFRNQAPSRIRDMFQQRRRWISGSLSDMHLLPVSYKPLYLTRIVVWGFSPVFVMFIWGIYQIQLPIQGIALFRAVSAGLLAFLGIYMTAGVVVYRRQLGIWAPVCILLTPVAVFLHSVGALWGLVLPLDDFKVTPKADPDEVEK